MKRPEKASPRRNWQQKAAKPGAPVIGYGLRNLVLGVHDKRAVLRRRLGDGLALQQQKLGDFIAVVDQRDFLAGAQI